MYYLSSSMTVLKPLAFILYFFFSSHFNLVLPFFHCPLNQSSVLLKSFLKITTYLSEDKFFTGIHFSTSFTSFISFTYLATNLCLYYIRSKYLVLFFHALFQSELVNRIFNMIFRCAPRIIV